MSYYFIIDYLYPRKRLAAQVSSIVSLISEARINYNSIEDALWNDDNDNKLRPLAERDSRETRKANRGVAFKGDRKKGPTVGPLKCIMHSASSSPSTKEGWRLN